MTRILAGVAVLAGLAALLKEILERRPATPNPATKAATSGDPPASRSSEPTRDELYEEAKRLDIKGRSTMNKAELQRAISDGAQG